jgi:di/tricarboxylate transporter
VVEIVEGGGFEGELGYGQFAIVLMMGASTAFATPIGFQTNLMVYGPGNYAFEDFLKMGGALTAFLAVCGGVLTNFIIKS